MAIKLLIGIGLAVLPFFVVPGFGGRPPKMAMALGLALTISLLALYQGKFKKFWNKWVLFFIGYLLINILFAPKLAVRYININITNFWVWQPVFYITVFTLMIITVYSIEWRKIEIRVMFSIMVWVGFLMALYMFAQAFRLEQFFELKPLIEITWPGQRHITGWMGHNTLVSPLVAMIIPIAIYLKRYSKALVMIVAVLLTNSQVAYGAMIVSLLFYFGTFSQLRMRIAILILALSASALVAGYFISPKVKRFVGDAERFSNWSKIIIDLKTPITVGKGEKKVEKKYPITGYSIGGFRYTYSTKNRILFHQAHNDYIELLYTIGYAGLALFLYAMWRMVKRNLSFVNPARNALLSSFVCIAIAAGGTFVWQLGTYIFYTAFIVGMLHKENDELWIEELAEGVN